MSSPSRLAAHAACPDSAVREHEVEAHRKGFLAHGCASLLVALAAVNLQPPPAGAAVDVLIQGMQTGGCEPMALTLVRLAELLFALQAFGGVTPSAKAMAEGCTQALRSKLFQIQPNDMPGAVAQLEAMGRVGHASLTIARERQAQIAESITTELAGARDESSLLRLLVSRPVNGAQICQGLGLLAVQVRRCPDPQAWAASIVGRPEFAQVLLKLREALPTLDAGFMKEALVALAELHVKDPYTLRDMCEALDSRLHSFTALDAAQCLWALCHVGMAQAPAFPRMMRTIDKQMNSLPAPLIAQLIRAIVPLGRAAACARLLPRLASALAGCNPSLDFKELLVCSRQLAKRIPLAEPLLVQLQRVITHEVSSEGDGALAGNLSPADIATSLWLFARHMPVLQQRAPHSPLISFLPQLIEQLLHLVAELESLSAEHLVDMVHVLARLQRPNTNLLPRLLKELDARLGRGQLRLAQVVEISWALFELHGRIALEGELTERLLAEIDKRANQEGPEQLQESIRLLGNLPMRRPWPICEPLAFELRQLDLQEPQLLSEVVDGLARLRYDDPKLLDAVGSMVERALVRGSIHEAQACSMVESFGTLNFEGRSGTLIPKLLERISVATALLPHSAAARARIGTLAP